ncbi:MAG TPA: ribosome biogenesis GTPase Der [Humisphaera sp.]|jgi:GTP-binding protein|nr:ribosome biogenesis GTPase Der [Humisphaera sp.]
MTIRRIAFPFKPPNNGTMPSLPTVAIVGRPNVGKSSLLNAIAGKLISIVQDMPGVTRDRISIPIRIDDRFVEIVDTGGYGFVDPDQLTDHIKHQIELAMTQAQLVLFVVDCQEGRVSADEAIASMLRRKGIKTVLIANKADGPKSDAMLGDFARLGLGTPLGVSATTGRNIEQIREIIGKNVDLSNAPTEPPKPTMLVAIVGKRNAGKSTLVNSIAEIYEGAGDRVIVSEIPGTTRDSVDVRFEKEGKTLVVIDTAGVRKKRHMVTNDIEFYSFHRAQRSIRRADVVMMLIDGTEPVSEPDKKLAQYIAEQFKPVILVVNKWDLTRQRAHELLPAKQQAAGVDDTGMMEKFREYLDQELRRLDFAPIAFVTAKDGKNVQGLLDLSQRLFNQANERVTTHRLNDAIRTIMEERTPSTSSGRRARIYYVTQTAIAPPTIVLFVNNPAYFNEAYQKYIMSRFRELLPYAEVPVKMVIRARERTMQMAPLDAGDAERPKKPIRVVARRKGAGRKPTARNKSGRR